MELQRTWISLAAAGAIIIGIAAIRGEDPAESIARDRYWIRKILAPAAFDVALGGDSRTYRSLSPAAMRSVLPGRRIYNYGFSGCAFSEEYLAALEGLLADPRTGTLVLGITPHSLTPRAARNNMFRSLSVQSRSELARRIHWEEVAHPFRTFLPSGKPLDFENEKGRFVEVFHPDGWVSAQYPDRPDLALRLYETLFDDNRVAPEVVADVLAAVRRWCAAGIRVVAFRPPVAEKILAIENESSGFDEPAFACDFTASGGLWLAFDPARYRTYDGSHLTEDSAREFSRDLAARLAAGD